MMILFLKQARQNVLSEVKLIFCSILFALVVIVGGVVVVLVGGSVVVHLGEGIVVGVVVVIAVVVVVVVVGVVVGVVLIPLAAIVLTLGSKEKEYP